jgi:hypothetical protein
MARIVLADDGVVFDGKTLDGKASGGGETAFVRLAEALAAKGHAVTAAARGAGTLRHRGDDQGLEEVDLHELVVASFGAPEQLRREGQVAVVQGDACALRQRDGHGVVLGERDVRKHEPDQQRRQGRRSHRPLRGEVYTRFQRRIIW